MVWHGPLRASSVSASVGPNPIAGTSNQASGFGSGGAADFTTLNMSGNMYMGGNRILDVGGLPPEIGEAKVDVELQEVDSSWALWHIEKRRTTVGRQPSQKLTCVAVHKFKPPRRVAEDGNVMQHKVL